MAQRAFNGIEAVLVGIYISPLIGIFCGYKMAKKYKLEKSLHIPVVIGTHPTEEGKRELKQRLKIVFCKCLLFLITILNLAIEKNVSFKAG